MAESIEATQQTYVRMSDIANEPKRMLMPIQGYEKMPLVSLEEAVLPLTSILPDVQKYTSVAKERCEIEPANGLTRDQSASIILYTMEWHPQEQCLYYVLNATLRGEDRQRLKPWFSYLKLILSGLARLPSSQCTVYRGVKKDLSKEYAKGRTFIWWGFSSCASSIEVLENEQFLGRAGTRTLFAIDCGSGKDISRHSFYQREKEVLLLPARRFQVMSCLEPAPDFHMIQLKEIEPQITLLEPVNIDPDADILLSDHKIDHSTDIENNVLKTIKDEIIHILRFDSNENKDKIIDDLLENGRQSLVNYQDDIIPTIYEEQMNDNNNELMKLLKKYFEQKWEIEYGLSHEWFVLYLKQYKDNDNTTHENVLTRTAEYGNKYMKNCPILSIVLQLLFKNIDNKCLEEDDLFNDLWITITNDGLKSIIKYSKYISEMIDELINKKQLILFQALHEYYHQELFQLFQQNNIALPQILYDLVLNNIVDYGWIDGIKASKNIIAPNNYNILLLNLHSFQVKPKIDINPTDVTCLLNETAKLNVKFSVIPKATVTWYKADDTEIKSNDHFQIINDDNGQSRLIINNVTLQDSKVYTVRATHKDRFIDVKVNLNVKEVKPILENDLEPQTINIGDELIYRLTIIDGRPTPTVKFYKDGNEVGLVSIEQSTISCNTTLTAILRIPKVTISDQGEYQASIENSAGSVKTKKAFVTVQQIPVFLQTPEDASVSDGKEITYEAQLSAFSIPKVTRLLNDKTLTLDANRSITFDNAVQNVSLTLRSIATDKHSNKITCQRENSLGKITHNVKLDVLTKLKIIKPLKDETVILGQDVTFTIESVGYPLPKLQWLFNDKPISVDDQRFQIVTPKEERNFYELKIKKTKPTDDGVYKVIMSNSEGEIYSQANLNVYTPPVISSLPMKMVVKQDERIIIPCEIFGKPKPEIKWFKGSQEYPLNQRGVQFIEESDNTFRLTINNATENDQGEYSISLQNSVGQIKSEKTNIIVNDGANILVRTLRTLSGIWSGIV